MKWKAALPVFISNRPFEENYNGYFGFIKGLENCKDF